LLECGNLEIDVAACAALVERRVRGEPIAYIIGQREFWSLDLCVTPDVLIPRPDSETLIEAAIAAIPPDAAPRILDLGTGSGALLLAALVEWPRARGVGVDRSPAALDVAVRNAAGTGLSGRAAFVAGDWAGALVGQWDLILANPPYVRDDAPLDPGVRDFEPAGALFAGADGLDAYRRIVPDLPRLLAPAGVAVVEIGHDQAAAVSALAHAAGLSARVRHDLAGRDRALILENDCV